MRLLLDLGRAYEGKRDYGNAFYYTRDLMSTARNHNALQYVRDAYRQMHLLHEQLHHTDSAYHYFRLYTRLKEEVAVDEFSRRLEIYKAVTESEKKQATEQSSDSSEPPLPE